MKFFITVLLLLLLQPFQTSAHPGRTASDGCHYCRTNCDSWGVEWDERHCHGAVVAPTPQYVAPKPQPITATPPVATPSLRETDVIAQVTEIVDGDTFKVKYGTTTETIRIVGIDTPETKDPRKPVQCFGKEATQKLSELIMGANVKLVRDIGYDNIDKYGRLLRYIHNVETNQDIGAEMVKQGYAYAYTKYPSKRMNEYVGYQKEASTQKQGLWSPDTCAGETTLSTSTPSSTSTIAPQVDLKETIATTLHWLIKIVKLFF